MDAARVAAVTMVKDEVDIIDHTVVHLLEEAVEHIVVADNGSTDGTRDMLSDLSREYPQLEVVDDPEVGYLQSEKMSRLAQHAADAGADWIIPFDADELWFDRIHHVAAALRRIPWQYNVVAVPIFNHFSTALDVNSDNPYERMVYRQPDPAPLVKVAIRWQPGTVIHQGNHGVTFPGEPMTISPDKLELRHFPYRSYDQFRRKAINGARAYAATDLPRDQGLHWREYGALYERHGDEALSAVYDRWFSFLTPETSGLILDPAPYRRWHHAANAGS